jgi:acyl-CoA synthetase (AMP-forming)/AMP-acid ligase II
MCPSYGLAEAVLTVTTSGPVRDPRFVEVTRSGLDRGRAESASGTGSCVTFVSSGLPLPGTEVRVLGPDGEPLPPGSIGEIAIAGPQVVRAPEVETATGFRRTGDVGFLWSGELVVVARHVEKLSIRGRTMYAAEIERFVADAFSETRPGRIGVVPLYANGTEQFAILAESADDVADEWRLARDIRVAVTREYGANPAVVRICARGSLPVTSSGKLDRVALRDAVVPGSTNREVAPR